jgi:hypothetical protein
MQQVITYYCSRICGAAPVWNLHASVHPPTILAPGYITWTRAPRQSSDTSEFHARGCPSSFPAHYSRFGCKIHGYPRARRIMALHFCGSCSLGAAAGRCCSRLDESAAPLVFSLFPRLTDETGAAAGYDLLTPLVLDIFEINI